MDLDYFFIILFDFLMYNKFNMLKKVNRWGREVSNIVEFRRYFLFGDVVNY